MSFQAGILLQDDYEDEEDFEGDDPYPDRLLTFFQESLRRAHGQSCENRAKSRREKRIRFHKNCFSG